MKTILFSEWHSESSGLTFWDGGLLGIWVEGRSTELKKAEVTEKKITSPILLALNMSEWSSFLDFYDTFSLGMLQPDMHK